MKVVHQSAHIRSEVVAIRCDCCGQIVRCDGNDNQQTSRINLHLGSCVSALAADLCIACSEGFFADLGRWQQTLREVEKFDPEKGYRYYDYRYIDARSGDVIRAESIIDEPCLR